jgi:hypothetical protein
MKKFDKILNEELSVMPTSSTDVQGKLDLVLETQKELQDAQARVEELQTSLAQAIEDYNFTLGVALRKRMPRVSVDFNNGKCSTRYRSTNLSCKPDLASGLWSFDQNNHGKTFTRRNGHALRLSNQVDPLVDAIVSYLTGRYRTLSR